MDEQKQPENQSFITQESETLTILEQDLRISESEDDVPVEGKTTNQGNKNGTKQRQRRLDASPGCPSA